MSELHPIIAVTGSSGAGTSSVKLAFDHIFVRCGLTPAVVEGDSFHRYDRSEMGKQVEKFARLGMTLTHFGPEGNMFDELEALFRNYAQDGSGLRRHYLHTQQDAHHYGGRPGTFTGWEKLPEPTDVLFYEGLHGGLKTDRHDVQRYADLLVGVVPIINLEWIQKIHRDQAVRGYSPETATQMILRRMPDYVHYICPQFSRTDINFQRVPTVDTSNPFTAPEIPTNDQSMVVIHIANRRKVSVDFRYLLEMLQGSFTSSPDTIVVPAGMNVLAMELILNPVVEHLLERRDRARAACSD